MSKRDVYGSSYQFSGLAVLPVDQSSRDTYGLEYQFTDLALFDQCSRDTYGLEYQFTDLVQPSAEPVLRCVKTSNSLTQSFQCIRTFNRLTVEAFRCVKTVNSLTESLQCIATANSLTESFQCIKTVNSFQVFTCLKTINTLTNPFACVKTANHLRAGVLSCTKAVSTLVATNPVIRCVQTSSRMERSIHLRFTEAGPQWFDEHGLTVSPPPPPPTPEEIVSGDLTPSAAGVVCATEVFKVWASNDGVSGYLPIDYDTVSVLSDHMSYAHELTLSFISSQDWQALVPLVSRLKVSLGAFTWVFIVEVKSRTASRQGYTYSMTARSQTIKLGDRIAERVTKDFEGSKLSEAFTELASAQGINVQFDIVDVVIAESALSSEDQAPIDIIVSAAKDMGAIVRSHTELPILYVEYPALETDPPIQELTYLNAIESLSEAWNWQPFWSSVIVSDQALTSEADRQESVSLQQVEDKIRAFTVPFQKLKLLDASNPGADFFYEGVHTEAVEATITIVCGKASLSKPFHEILSSSWLREDLGDVSVTESGAITTSVEGNSLLKIRYNTIFQQWSFDLADDEALVYTEALIPET